LTDIEIDESGCFMCDKATKIPPHKTMPPVVRSGNSWEKEHTDGEGCDKEGKIPFLPSFLLFVILPPRF